MNPSAASFTRIIVVAYGCVALLVEAAAAAAAAPRIISADLSPSQLTYPTGRALGSVASLLPTKRANVICYGYRLRPATLRVQRTAIQLRGGESTTTTTASSISASASLAAPTSSPTPSVGLLDGDEPRDDMNFDSQPHEAIRAKVSFFWRPLKGIVTAAGKLASATTTRPVEATTLPQKKPRPLDFLSSPATTVTKKRKGKHAPKHDDSHQQHHHFVSPCGRMAHEFGRVLVPDNKDASTSRIDVTRLIRAAEHYTAEMRRIGQKQSASDMERNIRKAKDLMHSAPHSVHHDMRPLLEHEKSTGIHQPHGHISDPSGAVGLLWIRRSLSYQHRMFDLVLNHHLTPPDAAAQAYRHELQPYHGWALQKLYTLAMSSMTPGTTEELLAKVGGYDLKDSDKHRHHGHDHHGEKHHGGMTAVVEEARHPTHLPSDHNSEASCRVDLQQLLDAWDPLLRHWKQLYHELDLEDPRRY